MENQWKLEDVISLIKLYYRSDEIHKLLDGSKSVTEIFGRLSKYFSFFNYSIIKLFANELDSTDIEEKMKQHRAEYSKLRICECPAGAFGSCEDKEKVYVLKTEMNLNDSLEEYDRLQFQINKVLGGKLLQLINVEEEERCVQLTFRVLLSQS